MATFLNPKLWKKNEAYQIGEIVISDGEIWQACLAVPAGKDLDAPYWMQVYAEESGGGSGGEELPELGVLVGVKRGTVEPVVNGVFSNYTNQSFFNVKLDSIDVARFAVLIASGLTYDTDPDFRIFVVGYDGEDIITSVEPLVNNEGVVNIPVITDTEYEYTIIEVTTK